MDADVELPDPISDDDSSDNANNFDEDTEPIDDEEFELWEDAESVPSPDVAEHLCLHNDIAEFYSQPRVLPAARQHGLRGSLSLDLLTGWNMNCKRIRELSLKLLEVLTIAFLVLSPPCTAFSDLQRLWNYKRMTAAMIQSQWDEGMLHLRHAMACAVAQHRAGRFFVFEHPAKASSWRTEEVKNVRAMSGVFSVVFDQCTLGLTSKVTKTPMRKRTRLLTSSAHIVQLFSHKMCDNSHPHVQIHGTEGGVWRSVWAQYYPAPMVDLIVLAAVSCVT